jgi:hypothetical protein
MIATHFIDCPLLTSLEFHDDDTVQDDTITADPLDEECRAPVYPLRLPPPAFAG